MGLGSDAGEVLEKRRCPRRHGGEKANSRKNIARHYHGWGNRGINLSALLEVTALRVEGDENGADGAGGVVRMLVRASGKSHLEPFETRLDGKTKKNVVVTMMGLSRRSRGQRPLAHQMVELSRLDRWVLLVVPDSAQPREV